MSLKILLNGLEYFFTDRHHGRQNVFHGLTEERQNVFLSAGVSIGQFKGSFNLGNRMGRSLVLPNFIFMIRPPRDLLTSSTSRFSLLLLILEELV